MVGPLLIQLGSSHAQCLQNSLGIVACDKGRSRSNGSMVLLAPVTTYRFKQHRTRSKRLKQSAPPLSWHTCSYADNQRRKSLSWRCALQRCTAVKKLQQPMLKDGRMEISSFLTHGGFVPERRQQTWIHDAVSLELMVGAARVVAPSSLSSRIPT